jgi:hypothetical protein
MKVRSFVVSSFCAACVYGAAVIALYRPLDDSPYAFNLGSAYPSGINLDLGNSMSVAWDVIVLGGSKCDE